jgi:hypothetical protein
MGCKLPPEASRVQGGKITANPVKNPNFLGTFTKIKVLTFKPQKRGHFRKC